MRCRLFRLVGNSLIGTVQPVLFIMEWGVNRRVNVACYISCYLCRVAEKRMQLRTKDHQADGG